MRIGFGEMDIAGRFVRTGISQYNVPVKRMEEIAILNNMRRIASDTIHAVLTNCSLLRLTDSISNTTSGFIASLVLNKYGRKPDHVLNFKG